MDENLIENDHKQLLKNLDALNLTNLEFAQRLQSWGDTRKTETIIRSIQRMKSEEIPVSGEMKVVLNMLNVRQKQMKLMYENLEWNTDGKGVVSTQINQCHKIVLYPETRGRWRVSITHSSGYRPPWPVFPKNLDEAKRKALVIMEDTIVSFETGVLGLI